MTPLPWHREALTRLLADRARLPHALLVHGAPGIGKADFARATTFNLDEFAGIDGDHPGSYRVFMREHLFSRVNLPPDQIHFLNGAAADPDAECERYETAIAAAGGIDLQILGIGTNGHIGSNEPFPGTGGRTRLCTLDPETRRALASDFFGDQ